MMTKTIPHGAALVVLVGPSGSGKSTFANEHFEAREIVSSDDIREEFTGDFRRQDKNNEVFAEFHRRIEAKLLVGQRVVADATHLRNADRKRTAQIAKDWGFPVIYVVINRSVESKFRTAGWRADVRSRGTSLIEAHEETFVANEKTILAGDHGVADLVVDTRVENFNVAQPLPRDPNDAVNFLWNKGFTNIRVIGDVHGNMEGLTVAVETAPSNTFFLFLGDVVDYGPGTLLASMFVRSMVSRGEAISLRGNHEKKIARFVEKDRTSEGFMGEGTHGNNVTINQLKAMDPTKRLHWESRFLSLVDMSPDSIQLNGVNGSWMFAHAAVAGTMWDDTIFRYHDKMDGKRHSYALYGETEKGDDGKVKYHNGYPIRKYDWVDWLPPHTVAVVGHAVLSTHDPVVKAGKHGGMAIFLDTGSSKEVDGVQGHLSWMDLRIVQTKKGFTIEHEGDFGRE